MDACEPRLRRRGFFLHSSDGGEPDTGEHENPEGFIVRVRIGRATRSLARSVSGGRSSARPPTRTDATRRGHARRSDQGA